MDRVVLFLLAVDGEVLHLHLHFFADGLHQEANPRFLMFQILRCVGANANHVVKAVEKLDIPIGKRAFDFSKSGGDIVGKRRSREIHDKFLAEIERGSFRKR